MDSSQEAPVTNFKHEPQVKLSSVTDHVQATLVASNGTEFRREFSDVTLAYDDGQVQSYKGLLALIAPWLGQLLLAAGAHCDMVILPGTDSQASPFKLLKVISRESDGKKEYPEDKNNVDKSVLPIIPKNEIQASLVKSKQSFTCDGSKKCKRIFISESNLINHKLYWHPEYKTHMCVPCNKGYENGKCLRKHFQRFHKGLDKTDLTCTECGKVFAITAKLIRHKKKEHEAGYCFKCGKVFSSGRKLRSHRSTCLKKKIIKSISYDLDQSNT